MQNETEYKKSKGLHKTIQAGVFHCGEPFAYLNENWPNATIMPPCIRELKDIAGERTGKKYDIALFKVYQPGESLALHRDVDGSDMSVACFTFYTDKSQKCQLDFCKYKSYNYWLAGQTRGLRKPNEYEHTRVL